MKYYADDWLTIYQGDVRDVLPELPADSVDCIVTSPPYWGLRDYGTASWSGGSEDCDHMVDRFATPASEKQRSNSASGSKQASHTCPKCGAIRQDSQLGLEPTPEQYVANMVAVFRELRRVLKPTGTCWLNLGDSYAAGKAGRTDHGVDDRTSRLGPQRNGLPNGTQPGPVVQRKAPHGYKPKDLVGIPWRVAFALQADGWFLRSDIIWAKPNPMPESVTDRPTKAHEYLFLLTKSARYFYDADAVREPHIEKHLSRYGYDFWPEGTKEANGGGRPDGASNTGGSKQPNPLGRNLRSVWTIATRPYPGAHFAVFPPELPERCIKAGSSERGVCPECGAPWERVVERAQGPAVAPSSLDRYGTGDAGVHRKVGGQYQKWLDANPPLTTGWQSACGHVNESGVGAGAPRSGGGLSHRDSGPVAVSGGDVGVTPIPAVVLDPFAGSGTTGMVANRLSRRAILIDLNGDYLKQQLQRNAQTPLGLGAA